MNKQPTHTPNVLDARKKSSPPPKKVLKIGLIGNPNCGKTTLFNRLTGSQQTTGNWPGVTVKQTVGNFEFNQHHYDVVDLPGIYSLEQTSHSGLDEQVACQYLQTASPDLIINVVDATSLERQLFLTAQLLHMGQPVVVVLNRMDLLGERNLQIDSDKLAEQLGCPVIPVSAYYNKGIDLLKQRLPELLKPSPAPLNLHLPDALRQSVLRLQKISTATSCWQALQYLLRPLAAPQTVQQICQAEKQRLEALFQEDLALIIADLYFQFAHDAAHACQIHTDQFTRSTTDRLDHWLLHPYLGMPIFLGIMYLVFALSITMGNAFLDFFDLGAQALFVDGPTVLLESIHAPSWLISFLAQGIGSGIQVVATFIPVIGALFLMLSIMEETGYMQRAALVMDNLMRHLGLSGQAFIPLIIGFGCNIPAVLATRTLPNQRDRIMTSMMTPFMSCSARLTVYVMFATAFFTEHAALIVFSLYLVGILAAILTALLLKHTLLPGNAPALLMELPIYHKPALLNVLLSTRNKLKSFILDAGKIIVIVVLVINFFNSLGTDGTFGNENQPHSVLSTAAKLVTPVVEPLGITEENWPATVGLITGLLAKEVVVGSLDALYQNQSPSPENSAPYDFIHAMHTALATIPNNLSSIVNDITDPLGLHAIDNIENKLKVAEDQGFTLSTLDKMVNHFDGYIGAYAYLLLILLYFPCIATFSAIKQELGWKWALYSGGWSMTLGYSVAVGFYQTATFNQHPTSSLIWLSTLASIMIAIYLTLRHLGKKRGGDKNDSAQTQTLY